MEKRSSPASAVVQAKGAVQGDHYFSRAVGKALDAIEILDRNGGPLSLAQFAKKLALTKPSVFRVLHTLEVAGYLKRSPEGHYALAPERRRGSSQLVNKLVRAAEQPMKELNRQFRETVSLAVLFDNHIEVVAVVESPQLLKMGNIVGRIIPPHASSLGKTIAACQPDDVREKLLRSYGLGRFTPNTITDESDLKRELDRTRARGYATDREESSPHGCCFAAPILGHGAEAVAAISVSMPISRLETHNRARLVSAIRDASKRVSSLAHRRRVPAARKRTPSGKT